MRTRQDHPGVRHREVLIQADSSWSARGPRRQHVLPSEAKLRLDGLLAVPAGARGLVLFAHGSGSGRFSARNQRVAEAISAAGFATLLFDLLTSEEERVEAETRHLRFNIGLLAERLRFATEWAMWQPQLSPLPIGYFGASTGAAAALVAAAEMGPVVNAIVSRGGRPDLAGSALGHVRAPTLLLVGSEDEVVVGLNEKALAQLRGVARLTIIPGATHLFEEPGTLEAVAEHAVAWFETYLAESDHRS